MAPDATIFIINIKHCSRILLTNTGCKFPRIGADNICLIKFNNVNDNMFIT